jgi:Transmembrane protein 65
LKFFFIDFFSPLQDNTKQNRIEVLNEVLSCSEKFQNLWHSKLQNKELFGSPQSKGFQMTHIVPKFRLLPARLDYLLPSIGNPRRVTLGRNAFFSSSTSSSPPSEGVKTTANSISWMCAQVSIHGEYAALEWASRLSPTTQRELNQLMVSSSSHSMGAITQAAADVVPEPSKRDLSLVILNTTIPFIGFGIMDNALLIIAGDVIDTSLGVALGISTMCAAAIGNIISDVAGVMLGAIIEDYASRLGIPIPDLSTAQRQLRSVRFANQFGCALGLVIGCIIGMFPLLLIDSNKIQKMKQEAKLDLIFSDVVTKAKELIGAEITNLYLIVDSKETTTPTHSKLSTIEDAKSKQQYFYSKHGHSLHIPVGRGVITRAALTGKIENIKK